MELYQDSQPGTADGILRKENCSFELATSVPNGQAMQKSYQRSLPGDSESDSKSVQVPSLSADDSSRGSSINNLGTRSETDFRDPWVISICEDGFDCTQRRSGSPLSINATDLPRTLMGLGTLSGGPPCDPHYLSMVTSTAQPSPRLSEQDLTLVKTCQTSIPCAQTISATPAIEETKSLIRQLTLDPVLSDSEDESDEDSDDNLLPRTEWSGTNDNIEAALYEAVYPDLELAAHLISTLYPTIALSYMRKISNKVFPWQEKTIATCATDSRIPSIVTETPLPWQKKNIATCGTDSENTSTATETTPQAASHAGNTSSSKHNIQSRSPDEGMEDGDDGDMDDSRRKRRKEKDVDDKPVMKQKLEMKLACPFFKNDPIRYSVHNGHQKVCAGPGFSKVALLKEHLKRVHRPIQCVRCWKIFQYKGTGRSRAIEQRDDHIGQEIRCVKNPDLLLKEGISDAVWSRLGEMKKSRKGKGKFKEDSPEKSSFEQWTEIWVILFPGIKAPPTPWYNLSFPDSETLSLPQGPLNFVSIFENVARQKLSGVRAAAAASEEDLLAILIYIAGAACATCAVGYSYAADSSTSSSSFCNVIGIDPFSSEESGSWQPVHKEQSLTQQLPVRTDSIPRNLETGTRTVHAVAVGSRHPREAMLMGQEMNTGMLSQMLSPNTAYAQNSQKVSVDYDYGALHPSGYPAVGQNGYHNPSGEQITYPNIPGLQDIFNIPPVGDFNAGGMEVDFDIEQPYQDDIPDMPNSSSFPSQWSSPGFAANHRASGGAT